jgi:hypothetical protein
MDRRVIIEGAPRNLSAELFYIKRWKMPLGDRHGQHNIPRYRCRQCVAALEKDITQYKGPAQRAALKHMREAMPADQYYRELQLLVSELNGTACWSACRTSPAI